MGADSSKCCVAEPTGTAVQDPPAAQFVDYEPVRADLRRIMCAPEWDDGSYAPLFIRLAWHSSGTYSKYDGSGGSNGATMRHALEAEDPENAGLGRARQLLEKVKKKHSYISSADLWILAAYVALEMTGGPIIEFTGGRQDLPEKKAIAPGRLPGAEKGLEDGMETDEQGRLYGWENLALHIRDDIFGRMGFNDQEIVALLCGGHVYGRCHTENSGYAGAWVENPTLFSNEYAADMVGDKWTLVTEDTVIPGKGQVPEEVRPGYGKRQYVDLTKIEGEAETRKVAAAPDSKHYPPGRYRCCSTWVNCREASDTRSPIIGRIVQEEELNMLQIKLFGTALRARTDRGGWVSILASGGKVLFRRVGEFKPEEMTGRYRVIHEAGVPSFDEPGPTTSPPQVRLKTHTEFSVSEVEVQEDGTIYGRNQLSGYWVMLHTARGGPMVDRIVDGWNERPRRPIKGQSGHQMMLVSDMVMLWDEGFRQHLEVYAEDEEKLKADFGAAFKRLTELGCPWSEDSDFITRSPSSLN